MVRAGRFGVRSVGAVWVRMLVGLLPLDLVFGFILRSFCFHGRGDFGLWLDLRLVWWGYVYCFVAMSASCLDLIWR